jgi:hypothetical protein
MREPQQEKDMQPAENPSKPKHASILADRCAGLARCLTYNKDETQSTIKHTLRECSYFIDSQVCRTNKNSGGVRILNARGKSRFMTWRERVAMFLLKGKLEIRP